MIQVIDLKLDRKNHSSILITTIENLFDVRVDPTKPDFIKSQSKKKQHLIYFHLITEEKN